MKNRLLCVFVAGFLCFMCIIPFQLISASSDMTISVGNVTATSGKFVDVPIVLSGNTGICGATILVTYDYQLELTNITQGSCLSTLAMTKPGDMTSNPFTLVWDGMEQDSSNGTIAVLSFRVPNNTSTYNISLSCENGDVVDGQLIPIIPVLQNGSITVNTDDSSGDSSGENIVIGDVSAKPETTVEVPITLFENPGICGATLIISYDDKLILTDVVKGSGLSTLTMTKPGDLSSSPCTLVWDGMEQDTSNGIIATLVFIAPAEIGTYPISVNYDTGDIVDGKLQPVSLSLKNGSITVKNDDIPPAKPITSTTIKKLTSTYKFNISSEIELNEENIIVAAYSEDERLISVKMTTFDGDTEGSISIPKNSDISYAKVFVWTDDIRPLGRAEIITEGF